VLPPNEKKLPPCLSHQHRLQANASFAYQAKRKAKGCIEDACIVPLFHPDEAVGDIQAEAAHGLEDIRDDLAQEEDKEETEVLDSALAEFHPSCSRNAPK
jgi:hypothetical protein